MQSEIERFDERQQDGDERRARELREIVAVQRRDLDATVLDELDALADSTEDGPGPSVYEASRIYRRKGVDKFRVFFGNKREGPSITVSSDMSEEIADFIRETWPHAHYVSRCDVKLDLSRPGLYEELSDKAKAFAAFRGLSAREIVPVNLDEGRSFYLGSEKSDVHMCIYEKGKEQAVKRVISLDEADLNAVRIEFRFRPQKEWKELFAHMSPSRILGTSKWVRDVLEEMEIDDVEKVELAADPRPGPVKSVRHASKQYRKALREVGRALASGEITHEDLGELCAEIEDPQELAEVRAGMAVLGSFLGIPQSRAWLGGEGAGQAAGAQESRGFGRVRNDSRNKDRRSALEAPPGD